MTDEEVTDEEAQADMHLKMATLMLAFGACIMESQCIAMI